MSGVEITVRPFIPADGAQCECVIRDAFWNVYRPGAYEHFLWHLAMRGHSDVDPELSLVATSEDTVVGCIMSTRARLTDPSGAALGVVVPGPLAVRPDHQNHGVGAALMTETLSRARRIYPAAFLYGNPAYYSRFGFRDASDFHVTTAAGDNFPAFMGMELQPGTLNGVGGRLTESKLFEIDDTAVDAFDEQFPPRRKARTSTQL